MKNTIIANQPLSQKVSHSIERMSASLSTILRIHDQYSTVVGATQPMFDAIGHFIRNSCNSVWHSKSVAVVTKAIGSSVNQSKIIQNGIEKIITIVTHENFLSVRVKKHLLNQDPRIQKIRTLIDILENKIQTSYCKLFNKPILMDKMHFSVKEYQIMTRHFQEFLSMNQNDSASFRSTPTDDIEDLIEFIENNTSSNSQALKEQIVNTLETLICSICQPIDSSKDPKVLEAEQAFQNCYFLFLTYQLLNKLENGQIDKDDLLLFLKNYKTSAITRLLSNATIENVGEVCAGMIGEVITESSLAIALHREVDKKILGPIFSISPLHSLLGSFSSYLGITLTSYIGIKALGSEESLKDYVHNMTWATIASMITEYALEIAQISNPIYTSLVPLIASSIAYNFSTVYEPLLKRKYLSQTISENYPQLIETMENLVEEQCVTTVKEKIQDINIRKLRRLMQDSISEHVVANIFENISDIRCIVDFATDPLNSHLDKVFDELLQQGLLLDKFNSLLFKTVVNYFLNKDLLLTFFFERFSQFYQNLINDENLLKDFYAQRSKIIDSSAKFSSNNNVIDMPDMKNTLIKLICSISPSRVDSSITALLLTKIDEILPFSLFQSLSRSLEKSLQFKIHPFSTMDPLFLEMVVKSFLVTILLEVRNLPGNVIYTDSLFLQSILKSIDSLIHINLIGQKDKKSFSIVSLVNYMIYKIIHAEIHSAVQSVLEMPGEVA